MSVLIDADKVVLKGDDGDVEVRLHGATITSWRVKGIEILFLSEKAILDNVKAIRGGIPVVFPQFGPWALGPNHGFARISRWTVVSHGNAVAPLAGDETASKADSAVPFVTLQLEDSDATRAMWPFKFRLQYTVTLMHARLQTHLVVDNMDSKPFDFTALLHTYIRVPAIKDVTVSGLRGLTYTDKVLGGAQGVESRELVNFDQEVDRVYAGALHDHVVTNIANSRPRVLGDHSTTPTHATLTVQKAGLPDTVVWNPWIERTKTISDLKPEEYNSFVCVEAGHVAAPLSLSPGQRWQASQDLVVAWHT